jgi:hypothetical protein
MVKVRYYQSSLIFALYYIDHSGLWFGSFYRRIRYDVQKDVGCQRSIVSCRFCMFVSFDILVSVDILYSETLEKLPFF